MQLSDLLAGGDLARAAPCLEVQASELVDAECLKAVLDEADVRQPLERAWHVFRVDVDATENYEDHHHLQHRTPKGPSHNNRPVRTCAIVQHHTVNKRGDPRMSSSNSGGHTAGPMASAASVEGAMEPTARPSADAAKDSSVRMPKNLANLGTTRLERIDRLQAGLGPVQASALVMSS
jgi:hypothetical protein